MRKATWLVVGISVLAVASLAREGGARTNRPKTTVAPKLNLPVSPHALDKLEAEITFSGVMTTFWVTLGYAVFVGILFSVETTSKETTEYWSYIFPICAAIFAGATAFIERRKGLLFIATLFFLYLGIAAFIALKDEHGKIISASSALLVLITAAHVLILAVRSLRSSFKVRGARGLRHELIIQLILVGLLFAACSYGYAFFSNNEACITAPAAESAAKCQRTWVIWGFEH
ncbi:glucan phosphoethanolaminetransferase (alkaline phosphatase superfamily) [Luteibacter jiangsuensis]|uniref:Glucan phosphoethanolaminetransferase (Alkaline phosphatase superfamily) n=1 Tax=Luteibacter jiangsuensis TaxID=637577 RepID=A0ABT9STZ2_9GAMM|nr:hypothetical protein [Luteibacter jiangsuensis]MDQ0008441.1 glucan phosphoethanolaminetransferase (alkaline phosphatase superfamily) [Luteibacter jiangsuensis]